MPRYVLRLACPVLLVALMLLTGFLQSPIFPGPIYVPAVSLGAIFGSP